MNIEIFPEMMKWKDVIIKEFGGAMFFLYDNHLVNLYECLSRLTDNELKLICDDSSFHKMCDIITSERNTDFGTLSSFVNDRGMLNIEGILPILSSFPNFDDAMNFIMRIKPGFRYTRHFKNFSESKIRKVDNGISIISYNNMGINNEETIYDYSYHLGQYEYRMVHTENSYRIEYLKGGKLHRINGPASITLTPTHLWLTWYRDGVLYHTNSEPSDKVYVKNEVYIFDQDSKRFVLGNVFHYWREYIKEADKIHAVKTYRFHYDKILSYSVMSSDKYLIVTYNSRGKVIDKSRTVW